MGKFEVKPEDAMIFEEIEQRELRRQRFEKMLKTVPLKKRDKYKKEIGNVVAGRFNDKQLHERTLKKVYAYNAGNVEVSDAMVRGGAG
jgi:hypothetical protein